MKVIAEVSNQLYYWSPLCWQSEINSADSFSTAKPDCSCMTSMCYCSGNMRNVTVELVATTILQYLDLLMSAQQRTPGCDGFSGPCRNVQCCAEQTWVCRHITCTTKRSERVDPSGATVTNTLGSAAGTYIEKWGMVKKKESTSVQPRENKQLNQIRLCGFSKPNRLF